MAQRVPYLFTASFPPLECEYLFQFCILSATLEQMLLHICLVEKKKKKMCVDFYQTFSAFMEMIIFFSSLALLMTYLVDFMVFNYPCISGITFLLK